VTLTGTVDWYYQRMEADHAVAGLYGVTSVANGILVRPQTGQVDLSLRIKAAIERQAACDASRVTVTVKDGAVTLGGTLPTLAEREAVVNAAWSAPGVSSVSNNIRISL